MKLVYFNREIECRSIYIDLLRLFEEQSLLSAIIHFCLHLLIETKKENHTHDAAIAGWQPGRQPDHRGQPGEYQRLHVSGQCEELYRSFIQGS